MFEDLGLKFVDCVLRYTLTGIGRAIFQYFHL